jgi:hypothetical protein
MDRNFQIKYITIIFLNLKDAENLCRGKNKYRSKSVRAFSADSSNTKRKNEATETILATNLIECD